MGKTRRRKQSNSVDTFELMEYGVLFCCVILAGFYLAKGNAGVPMMNLQSSIMYVTTFLPVALVVYHLTPRVLKNMFLFLFSVVMIGWTQLIYLPVFLLLTGWTYLAGIGMVREADHPGRMAKAYVSGVIVQLLLWAVFGYMIILTKYLGNTIIMPIGLGLVMLRSISYLSDVMNGKCRAEVSYVDLAIYLLFFGLVQAGPVSRYHEVQRQLARRNSGISIIGKGARDFLSGLAKVVVFSYPLGNMFEALRSAPEKSLLGTWIALIAYSFGIYYSIGGLVDMACGVAGMFGFTVENGFRYPLRSGSLRKFWTRWNGTLTGWFEEYITIPLAGGKMRTVKGSMALFASMTLFGLWHGAHSHYLIFGIYTGACLFVEKSLTGKIMQRLPGIVQRFLVFLTIGFGWILLFSPGIPSAMAFVKGMIGKGPIATSLALYELKTNLVLLILAWFGTTPIAHNLANAYIFRENGSKVLMVTGYVALMILCLCCMVSGNSYSFVIW